ncbi:hypothetical protein [Haloparvum sp. AD34]
MRSEIYLFAAGIASFGFAAANFLLNDGTILPGWILLGLIFVLIGAGTLVFGSSDDDGNGAGA